MAPAIEVDLDPLYGREADLASIADRLAHARLVSLTGPGGSGKTRLALAIVAAEAAAGRDAWFVDASAVREAGLLAPAIAATLHVEGGVDETPLAGVASALADRDTLLALDNLEQLDEAGSAVADLLAAAPRLRILATSRFRLGTRGEIEIAVPTLALPETATPEAIETSPAGALLLARARAIGRLDRLDAAAATDVAALLRRLDGLPLAIELAAARTRIMTPGEMCQWLDRQGLSAVDVADADAHHSLRRILDWTLGLLTPPQAQALGAMSVAAGFDLELATALAPDLNVIGALDSLVALGLVQPAGVLEGISRFRLLETIRGEVAGRLTTDERTRYRERHAAAMITLASTVESRIRSLDRGDATDRLDGEADNFRLALDRLDEADPRQGLILWRALHRFWRSRNRHREGMARFERTAALAPEPSLELSRAMSRYVGLQFALHGVLASRALNLRALDLAREVADLESEVEALGGVAMVAVAENDAAAAREAADRGVVIASTIGDPDLRASAAQAAMFATMASHGAASDEMRDALVRMRDAATEARNLELELISIGNLAAVHLYRAEFDAAIPNAERALHLARLLHHQLLNWCLGTLATCLAETGEVDRAVEALTEATRDVAILGVPDRMVDVLGAGVAVALGTGHPLLAARLRGAIDKLAAAGASVQPDDLALSDRVMDRVRQRAAPGDVEVALREGAAGDPGALIEALPRLLAASGPTGSG